MTPQAKAKELLERFSPHAFTESYAPHKRKLKMLHRNAKACAKICCEEIINTLPDGLNLNVYGFWHQTKKEVEKL